MDLPERPSRPRPNHRIRQTGAQGSDCVLGGSSIRGLGQQPAVDAASLGPPLRVGKELEASGRTRSSQHDVMTEKNHRSLGSRLSLRRGSIPWALGIGLVMVLALEGLDRVLPSGSPGWFLLEAVCLAPLVLIASIWLAGRNRA